MEHAMKRSRALNRRDLVRYGVSAGVLSGLVGRASNAHAAAPSGDAWLGLKVGIASYTFNKIPLDATIKAIERVGVSYVSIKEGHLPLKSSESERKEVVAKFKAAGITPLSCGVVNMTDDESMIRNAFEYARDASIPTIVCKPTRQSLPFLDKMVKEFDLRLAIHNHGPEDKGWPSPYDALEAIQRLDQRIGVCIDVGHTARCGVDPTEAIRRCAERLYDVHMKDIAATQGRSRPVEVGRGVLDVRSMLRALLDMKYAHHVGLEYEKDMQDPLAGVAESIGYMRGTLSGLRPA
jgi:sugar phosphate isomerase/epimerase